MVRSWIIAVVAITALGWMTSAGAEPVVPGADTGDRLVERDKLFTESQQLAGKGKFAEGIARAEKVLDIERQVLGESHANLLSSLAILIRWNAILGNLEAAQKLATDNLQRQRRDHPENHWRVKTARGLVGYVERYQGLDQPQRDKLKEGERLYAQGSQLAEGDKYQEAAPILAKAADLRKQILGEESPEYLASLNNLGWCYC